MPYAPFCISVGYIWGVSHGFLIQGAAIFLSSVLIYLITYFLDAARLQNVFESYRLSNCLFHEVRDGWLRAARMNLIMCFIPMPYGLHAYFFAVCRYNFLLFIFFFEIGMIGHTFLNLSIGNGLAASFDNGSNSKLTLILSGVSIGLSFFAISYGIFFVR